MSVGSRLPVDYEFEDGLQELIGEGQYHPRVVVVEVGGRQAACVTVRR
jgi:hypothetical protein